MAKVNFVYERENNTDLIDRDIVYYENNKPFVYIVDNDNTIKKNFITLGISNDEKVEVKSGINKTTKLVSTWNNDLVEGVKVDVLNEETAKELEKIYDTARKNDAALEKEEKYKKEAKYAKEIGEHESRIEEIATGSQAHPYNNEVRPDEDVASPSQFRRGELASPSDLEWED